jgi:hypothetical protein
MINNPFLDPRPAIGGFVVSGATKSGNLNRMSGVLEVSNCEISHPSNLTRGIVKMLQSEPWESSPFAKFHFASLASFILLTRCFCALKSAKIR